MASLSCGYWNIHGHSSELIGDKLSDPEFLHMLKNVDILGLGELHAESYVSIPGFVRKKQKIREKNQGSKSGWGDWGICSYRNRAPCRTG